jgi:putative iron-regulated protein
LGTALLVGSTTVGRAAISDTASDGGLSPSPGSAKAAPPQPRVQFAEVGASGEGGPGEGGGQVLGTITEFRLSTTDGSAFVYEAKAEVAAYAALVHDTYVGAHTAAVSLKEAIAALLAQPSPATLEAARVAWSQARTAYLRTEAYQFYAGPIDGPSGPLPRLNGWPVDPAAIDAILADAAQPLDFRSLARMNRAEAPVKITTGLHVIEYLLWGAEGALTADAIAGDARRGSYLTALAQLFVNDLSVLVAAWLPGVSNNYRASVESMDQRNALGRAFNGMAVLLGYELPLRRIGAGLFPANRNFQPSPYSGTSHVDNAASFAGARSVYFDTGIDELLRGTDAALATKLETGFERASLAVAAMNAPYERFLAPPPRSAERATAEAAARALTDLARDLRQAGNRLGVLVVVPGM